MTIGIVIPVHNGQRYLEETLRAVLAQTVPDWRLVVVDDGSTDDSAAMVERFAASDARIGLVRQARGGVSVARNRGLAELHASCGLVAFLDADDLWEPHALRILTDTISASRDVTGVHGYTSAIDGLGMALPATELHDLQMRRVGVDSGRPRVWPVERPTEFAVLALQDCVVLSSALFRRAVVERVGGFDPALRHFEDWAFLLRVTLRGPLAFTSAPIARKRHHESNVSNDAEAMWRGLREVRRQLFTQLRDDPARLRVALLGQRFSHRLNLGRELRHAAESLRAGASRRTLWHLRRALVCGVKDLALGGRLLIGP